MGGQEMSARAAEAHGEVVTRRREAHLWPPGRGAAVSLGLRKTGAFPAADMRPQPGRGSSGARRPGHSHSIVPGGFEVMS